MRPIVLLLLATVCGCYASVRIEVVDEHVKQRTPPTALESTFIEEVPCLTTEPHPELRADKIVPECFPDGVQRKCLRFIEDDIASPAEVAALIAMTEKGMAAANSSLPGPTIFDPNLGYVRQSGQTLNAYAKGPNGSPPANFTTGELQLFSRVFRRIKDRVAFAFGVPSLMYTAPFFVTRIVGAPEDGEGAWEPEEMHDEYYHAHVDGRSTPHYHYSGLLYLSTAGKDFEGGRFQFLSPSPRWNWTDADREADANSMEAVRTSMAEDDASPIEHEVSPRAGRFVAFTAGEENLHRVTRVTQGRRLAVSMWFTCSSDREMTPLLDGRNHGRVSSPTLQHDGHHHGPHVHHPEDIAHARADASARKAAQLGSAGPGGPLPPNRLVPPTGNVPAFKRLHADSVAAPGKAHPDMAGPAARPAAPPLPPQSHFAQKKAGGPPAKGGAKQAAQRPQHQRGESRDEL